MSDPRLTLYGTPLSGHVHRVEAFLNLLGLPYRYENAGADVRQSAAFRALNPLGQIPVLSDGDLVLADSNAILVYLAKRYDGSGQWYPAEAVAAAHVQRWLSIAAGEVRFGPCSARLIHQFGVEEDLGQAKVVAARVLAFTETHLTGGGFLVGGNPTIADLACYSYIAHAPEGGIPLDPYPAVQAWLARVEALPQFKLMPRSPIPA